MSALEDPRWLALSPERRQKLLDKHRGVNVESPWWCSVYESFAEKLTACGIRVDVHKREKVIYFSGFSSQGDGACFSGWVSDWKKFLTAVGGYDEKFLACDFTDLSLQWGVPGRYCHSGAMRFSDDLCMGNPYDKETQPLQADAWGLLTQQSERLYNDLSSLEDFIRGLADELYEDLEEEYDSLTDNEAVASWVLANFDEYELSGEEPEEENAEQV